LFAPLKLRLLDTPTLSVGALTLPALAPVDAALLALLALQGAQARQQAAALLWPDADAAGAATNLRQRIYRLKRLAGRVVVQGDRSITLPEDLEHDLQGYAELLAANPLHGRGALLGTLHFPGHEALSGWLAAQREALAQLRCRVLSQGAQAHAEQGRHTQALDFAQAWVHHAPLNEQAHRLLIQLLHQQGNRAGALAAYRHCENTLRAELGVQPGATTGELLAHLLEPGVPAPAQALAMPMALLRPPQLVARRGHWRQIAQAVAAGQTLVLVGEAGLGKSRLLGDFVSSRVGWCRVAGSPGDAALPFAMLARLLSLCTALWGRPHEEWVGRELARLAPEAGTPSSDPFALLRLQQAVRAALRGWQTRGMAGLAMDDLHHADASSLELLLPMATAAPQTPQAPNVLQGPGTTQADEPGLPWLMATRPAAVAAVPGLNGLPRLDLSPLSLPEVQDLVASLALDGVRPELWAPALLQRTGGNPLYLLQTLAAAFEAGTLQDGALQAHAPLPASLGALLAARLEKLSAPARSIARLACVAGPDFTLALACQLLSAQPAALADPWLELLAAQVMHDGRFAHDLIRDATVSITPPEVRGLIHAQVAQALGQAGAPPGRVAEHWDAAGRWPEAASAYEQAAVLARAHGAVADELAKLQAATRCHRATATAQATAAAFASEHRALELRVANTQLGDDTLQGCEALLATSGSDEQRAQAQVLLSYYWSQRYEPALGLPAAQSALQLAQACGNPALVLRAAQRLGGALTRLGRHEEALQSLRGAAADLRALPLDDRLDWMSDFGQALDYADQRSEALLAYDAVINEATAHKRWAVAAAALALKSLALLFLARTGQGHQAMEQSLAMSRQAGYEGAGLLVDEMTCAGNQRDLGHFSAYLQRAESLPQALRDAGNAFWAANAEHDLATAYAWLGRADLALRMLAGTTDGLPALMRAARLATRARLARDYGVGTAGPQPQALLQEALALLDEAQAPGRSHLRMAITLQTARDATPAAGLAAATQLQDEGLQRQNLMLATSAACVRLRILQTCGDTLAAAGVASDLMHRLGDGDAPAGTYPVELWWLAGQALLPHQPALAHATLARAALWLRHTARHHVPPIYQESFLARNPINAALLLAVQRLGL
jgi:DNA-binding SARP family transcriptional activator